jgi:hypothetical protein
LWNRVEAAEKRKDATLARELDIALPMELGRDEQIELIREFVRGNFVDAGMIADINLHNLDDHNPHAHVMLTTRDLELIGGDSEINFEFGFGKKNRDWNDKKLLLSWRENWAKTCNKFLERGGIEDRIDHRSNEARGLETLPQIKIGLAATRLSQKGYESERVEHNNKIKAFNSAVLERDELKNEIDLLEKEIENRPIEVPIEKLKPWQPGYRQSPDNELLETLARVYELNNQSDSFQATAYEIRIIGNERVEIWHKGKEAMILTEEGDWELKSTDYVINQFEKGLRRDLAIEIERLEIERLNREQLEREHQERESEAIESPSLEEPYLEFDPDLDFGGAENRTNYPSREGSFER